MYMMDVAIISCNFCYMEMRDATVLDGVEKGG
jgi:predicted signal transduction protein with EAL and GGDEF domain